MLTAVNGCSEPPHCCNSSLLKIRGRSDCFHSLTQPDLAHFTRSEIRQYFINAYELYELVFSAINDESSFYKSPDRLRLPLIFYLAHTSSVYINKLMLSGLLKKRVNMKFEAMFELGVDEMSWDDTENYRLGGAFQWPSVSEVMEYRKQVFDTVLNVIDTAPLDLPVTVEHPWWSVIMGIEHERIHFETTSVLLNQLPVSMLTRPPTWKYAPPSMSSPAGANELVRVAAGEVTMGKPSNFPSFGWDNEYGQVTMNVPEFEASKYLVTNKEFLKFVEDGGYQRKELWTEEGWQWVEFRQARHPIFWVCGRHCKSGCGSDLATYSHCNLEASDTQYRYRAIFDVIEMPWDWPVTTNYHEMKAFCAWLGPNYRAPTEAEHHRLRADPPLSLDKSCDPAFNSSYPANINLKYGSPCPVNMFAASGTGHHDVYGNLWEWGEDHFNGLPGFKTTYFYDDFSAPFFDGRHTMIMGGSWVSTGNETSRFTRFGFRRHFFQHAGFRYVRSSNPTPVRLCKAEIFLVGAGVIENSVNIPGISEKSFHAAINPQFQYETEESLNQQLQREYGNLEQYGLPVLRIVESAVEKYSVPTESALVLGSGGGVTTLLLTKIFSNVMGVEFSGRFMQAALSIQNGERVEFGERGVATVPVQHGAQPTRAVFKQLTWVPNEIVDKNFVLFEFVDRCAEPRGLFYKLWETLMPEGLLIVVASSKWDKSCISNYISNRFNFLEELSFQNGSIVTMWRLKKQL